MRKCVIAFVLVFLVVLTLPTLLSVDAVAESGVRGRSGVQRPEEVGENFSVLSSETLVDRLSVAADFVEERKAAIQLGNRSIAGELELSKEQTEELGEYIQDQIEKTALGPGEDRAEANHQIQRLWRLSVDGLIENLGHENEAIGEAAMKNLIMMRNEEIILRIIAEVKSSDHFLTRYRGVFALGMMTEKNRRSLTGRVIMDHDSSRELAGKHIIPFLNELKEQEQDPKMQEAVQTAFKFLAKPFDCRPQMAD